MALNPSPPLPFRTVLRRYPRLIAHLVCESCGCFNVYQAVHMLREYMCGEPFYCQWFTQLLQEQERPITDETVYATAREVLKQTVKNRRQNKGEGCARPWAYYSAYAAVCVELERSRV